MTQQTQQDPQWEEVGAEEAADRDYTILPLKNQGDSATGKLVKVVENVPGNFGPETHYIFEKPDGKFALNPNADLKKRLAAVAIGQIIRVTVTGLKDIGKPSPMRIHRVERFKGGAAPKPASAAVPF